MRSVDGVLVPYFALPVDAAVRGKEYFQRSKWTVSVNKDLKTEKYQNYYKLEALIIHIFEFPRSTSIHYKAHEQNSNYSRLLFISFYENWRKVFRDPLQFNLHTT
jgi:hypothetical protein